MQPDDDDDDDALQNDDDGESGRDGSVDGCGQVKCGATEVGEAASYGEVGSGGEPAAYATTLYDLHMSCTRAALQVGGTAASTGGQAHCASRIVWGRGCSRMHRLLAHACPP